MLQFHEMVPLDSLLTKGIIELDELISQHKMLPALALLGARLVGMQMESEQMLQQIYLFLQMEPMLSSQIIQMITTMVSYCAGRNDFGGRTVWVPIRTKSNWVRSNNWQLCVGCRS
jgi:hypothetical protein